LPAASLRLPPTTRTSRWRAGAGITPATKRTAYGICSSAECGTMLFGTCVVGSGAGHVDSAPVTRSDRAGSTRAWSRSRSSCRGPQRLNGSARSGACDESQMTRRRKGEKAVIHPPTIWSETGGTARSITSGDSWFCAWYSQAWLSGIGKLAKRVGIPETRLDQLWRSAEPTDSELQALAIPFRTDAASLRASFEYEQGLKGKARHGS
jgi:hypothetical protein